MDLPDQAANGVEISENSEGLDADWPRRRSLRERVPVRIAESLQSQPSPIDEGLAKIWADLLGLDGSESKTTSWI